MPTKGALTQARERISYRFFESQFNSIKSDFKDVQKTINGFYVYGVDGDIYSIPRNKRTEDDGFYGCPVQGNKESHFLRMYTVSAVDVFSGIPLEFAYGTRCNEIDLALSLVIKLEKKSICIYDRLFFSKKLIRGHKDHQSFFICRLQRTSFKEANALFKSNRRTSFANIEGVDVRLIKIKNPKSKEEAVFATNLPKEKFSDSEIQQLYIKRWESEVSNKDSTDTLKLEQFHSKNINGILQEVYIHLWFVCFSKMQIVKHHKVQKKNLIANEYEKSNYKEVAAFIIQNLPLVIIRNIKKVYYKMKFIIKRSVEKRVHNKRSNPRICKSYRRQYKGTYSSGGYKWESEIPCPPRTMNQEFQMNHC